MANVVSTPPSPTRYLLVLYFSRLNSDHNSKEVFTYNSFAEFYLIVLKEMQVGDLYEMQL